jgi:membrane-associated protease RseP (regulator of RpoE activity)
MRTKPYVCFIIAIAVVGLAVAVPGPATADEPSNDKQLADEPIAASADVNSQPAHKPEAEEQEELLLVEGNDQPSGEQPKQITIDEDVLILSDDAQPEKRVLRIDARPAGDSIAVLRVNASNDEAGKHWIGVEIHDVSPALRAQLNLAENRGVLIGRVLPDSPASKAGIKQYDILLAIGDQKIASNDGVLKSVKQADGKEMKLTILRGGSERMVTVTPAERPQPKGDITTARSFLDLYRTGNNVDVIRPGPAIVLRNDDLAHGERLELPDDLTITITRHGKEPAKIKIKQQEREIETTEEKLSEVPDDLQRYLGPMLAGPRGPFGFWTQRMLGAPQVDMHQPPREGRLRVEMGHDAKGDVLIPAPAGKKIRVERLPVGGPANVEQRLRELERRVDELQPASKEQGHDKK